MVNKAVLKSPKLWVPDFLLQLLAISSSHPYATLLHADSTVNAKGDILTNAYPHQIAFFTIPNASIEQPSSHVSKLHMDKNSSYDCVLADLHFSKENANDNPLSIPQEPLSDPAPPEIFGSAEQVSILVANHFMSANHPEGSHVLKILDDIVIYGKTDCQIYLNATVSVSASKE